MVGRQGPHPGRRPAVKVQADQGPTSQESAGRQGELAPLAGGQGTPRPDWSPRPKIRGGGRAEAASGSRPTSGGAEAIGRDWLPFTDGQCSQKRQRRPLPE